MSTSAATSAKFVTSSTVASSRAGWASSRLSRIAARSPWWTRLRSRARLIESSPASIPAYRKDTSRQATNRNREGTRMGYPLAASPVGAAGAFSMSTSVIVLRATRRIVNLRPGGSARTWPAAGR